QDRAEHVQPGLIDPHCDRDGGAGPHARPASAPRVRVNRRKNRPDTQAAAGIPQRPCIANTAVTVPIVHHTYPRCRALHDRVTGSPSAGRRPSDRVTTTLCAPGRELHPASPCPDGRDSHSPRPAESAGSTDAPPSTWVNNGVASDDQIRYPPKGVAGC